MKDLDKIYNEASVEMKQRIACFELPWKFHYETDEFKHRKRTKFASLIMLNNNTLTKGTMKKISSLPAGITRTRARRTVPRDPYNASALNKKIL